MQRNASNNFFLNCGLSTRDNLERNPHMVCSFPFSSLLIWVCQFSFGLHNDLVSFVLLAIGIFRICVLDYELAKLT